MAAHTEDFSQICLVALPAEGVDRNERMCNIMAKDNKSPSPRRAWIEIEVARYANSIMQSRPPRGGRG